MNEGHEHMLYIISLTLVPTNVEEKDVCVRSGHYDQIASSGFIGRMRIKRGIHKECLTLSRGATLLHNTHTCTLCPTEGALEQTFPTWPNLLEKCLLGEAVT